MQEVPRETDTHKACVHQAMLNPGDGILDSGFRGLQAKTRIDLPPPAPLEPRALEPGLTCWHPQDARAPVITEKHKDSIIRPRLDLQRKHNDDAGASGKNTGLQAASPETRPGPHPGPHFSGV